MVECGTCGGLGSSSPSRLSASPQFGYLYFEAQCATETIVVSSPTEIPAEITAEQRNRDCHVFFVRAKTRPLA